MNAYAKQTARGGFRVNFRLTGRCTRSAHAPKKLQAGALATVTTTLREQLLRQTSEVGLQITVAALGALSAKPELELTVGAEITKIVAEVVKQLNRRLSELEVGFCVRNRRACVRWDAVLGALTFGRLSQR